MRSIQWRHVVYATVAEIARAPAVEQGTTVQGQAAVGPAMVLVGVVNVTALEESDLTGASSLLSFTSYRSPAG
jgi:hypothetical protein